MTALDTNVLVRFLVRDDAAQCDATTRRIKAIVAAEDSVFIPDVVLVETVWVLRRSYRFDRNAIASVVGELVESREVRFADTGAVQRSLEAFQAGRGDFSDYLIREQARGAGCLAVLTFDEAVLAEAGFEAV